MRVFVLGAGASYGASGRQLPLARGFFNDLSKAAFPELFEFLSREFIGLPKVAFARLDITPEKMDEWFRKRMLCLNIEPVFVYLEYLLSTSHKASQLANEFGIVKSQLLSFIETRLQLSEEASRSTFKQYLSFTKRLSNQDSVISFNWDTFLDKAIKSNDQLQGYTLNQARIFKPHARSMRPSGGHYLKLHGSLNWYLCDSVDCPSSGLVLREALDNRTQTADYIDAEITRGETRCSQCGTELSKALIPPVVGKSNQMVAAIRAQWRIAEDVLRSAEEWIFIGYSFPSIDVEAWSLLKSASREYPSLFEKKGRYYFSKKIHVADPRATEIEERLNELIPFHFEVSLYKDFDNLLAAFEPFSHS